MALSRAYTSLAMPPLAPAPLVQRRAAALFALGLAAACAPVSRAPVPPPAVDARPEITGEVTGEVMRRWVDEIWHRGRLELVDSLVAPLYTRHESDGTTTVTRAAYAERIRELRTRFPDLWYEVHDSASVGDRFWIRYTFRGGPDITGPWPSVPGLQLYRLEDGRLAETWMLLKSSWTEWVQDVGDTTSTIEITASTTYLTAPAREPMVAVHPSGDLFLSGFGRPEHGGPAVDPLVPRLWRSGDRGRSWASVDVGGAAEDAVGNSDVDLAVAPDGTLYLVALRFDPENRRGVSIALGVSGDMAATWRWAILDRTPYTDRPWVGVGPDGTAHVVWNDGEGVIHVASEDGGASWSTPRRIHHGGGSSHMAVGPMGEVAVRIGPWSAAGNRHHPDTNLIAVSTDRGRSWVKRAPPAAPEWVRSFDFDGTPRRWVEPLAWDSAGALYALWSEGREMRLARSRDRGATWRSWTIAEVAAADSLELLYPYLVAGPDGELAATWMTMTPAWRFGGRVARIPMGDDGPVVVAVAEPFPLRSWGYGDDGQLWSDSAGEYFPVLFLPGGELAIALPVREPDEGRVGFEWRVYGR